MENNYTYVSYLQKGSNFRRQTLTRIIRGLKKPNEYSTIWLQFDTNNFMRFDFLKLPSGWTNIYINCGYYTSVKTSLDKFINEVVCFADNKGYLLICDLHSRGYLIHNPIKQLYEHPTSDKDKWLLYAVR